MAEPSDGEAASHVAWKRLRRDRPWYRKLASEPLAEARVDAPDGKVYFVRVRKNGPLVGPHSAGSPDLSTLFEVVRTNLDVLGETGWRIEVVAPPGGWHGETVLYTQPVGARAIVVDVILAITGALERGDKLWPEDEE